MTPRCRNHVLRCAAFVAASILLTGDARALRYQEHPPWMISLGWGFGRGHFTEASGVESRFRNGAAPQIHVGRKLSRRWMANLSYEAWLIEYDQERDGIPADSLLKFRDTLQLFGLGATLFPGNLEGASGGIYLRASAGLGWAGKAEVPVFQDVPLDHGDRTDHWGFGVGTGAGYDFWVHSNFQLGVGVTYNYFTVGEPAVDTGWFASTLLNVRLFF